MKKEKTKEVNLISQIIFDKKGFNILALDVIGVCSVTDYVIIAEGNIEKHNQAIANAIVKNFPQKPFFVEGLQLGDWIVLDYTDIIVHLFTKSVREKYQLETLWPNAKIVDLQLNLSDMQIR